MRKYIFLVLLFIFYPFVSANAQQRGGYNHGESSAESHSRRSPDVLWPEANGPYDSDYYYKIGLHTNLLYDCALVPNVGMEWKMTQNWSALVNGAWTIFDWDKGNKHYGFRMLSPELRYYFGEEQRMYAGAMFNAGAFNVKFGSIGKQGDIAGGGVVGGYLFLLNDRFFLDLGLGFGYTQLKYDEYEFKYDLNRALKRGLSKKIWGPTKLGVTLIWKIK